MMAQGIVVCSFSRRREYRVYLQGVKTCWRGNDQASTRDRVRNVG